MTIYHRGEWHYDLNIWPREGRFIWHVVRLKVDLRNVFGTLVATGISTSREEAEREGVATIDAHSRIER
jgi:hypothetical protein